LRPVALRTPFRRGRAWFATLDQPPPVVNAGGPPQPRVVGGAQPRRRGRVWLPVPSRTATPDPLHPGILRPVALRTPWRHGSTWTPEGLAPPAAPPPPALPVLLAPSRRSWTGRRGQARLIGQGPNLGPAPAPPPQATVLLMFDPDGAAVMGFGRTTAFPLSVGSAIDLPIQLLLIGGSPPPTGLITAADTVTLSLIGSKQTVALFTPGFSWYTPDGQTGYDQGQFVASISNAQGAQVEPTSLYYLVAWWTPASEPARSQLVARVPMVGKADAP
jgi:hypothetical protein